MPIKSRIRTIPDHPKPGILFRDITTLLGDHLGLRIAIESLAQHYKGERIAKVAGIEARGFILGGAIAHQLEAGFVPVRKQGKLPLETIGQDYSLEYGTDRIEIHTDAIATGERVLELLFEEQSRRGLSLLLVTHDSRLGDRCQRMLTMGDGMIQSDSATPIPD